MYPFKKHLPFFFLFLGAMVLWTSPVQAQSKAQLQAQIQQLAQDNLTLVAKAQNEAKLDPTTQAFFQDAQALAQQASSIQSMTSAQVASLNTNLRTHHKKVKETGSQAFIDCIRGCNDAWNDCLDDIPNNDPNRDLKETICSLRYDNCILSCRIDTSTGVLKGANK